MFARNFHRRQRPCCANPLFFCDIPKTGLINAQGRLMHEMAPDLEPFWFEIYGKIVTGFTFLVQSMS